MKNNVSCDEMIYILANTSNNIPEDLDDELPLETQANIELIANVFKESERNIREKFNEAYKERIINDSLDDKDQDEMIMQAEKDEWKED